MQIIITIQTKIMPNDEQQPSERSTDDNVNSNDSGLIVDFPINQPGAVKSVRFSATSEMIIIERPTKQDNRKKSYKWNDYEYFKRLRANDAVYCSNLYMYKKSIGENLTLEDVCNFTGLEFFLSRDVPGRFRAISQAREHHSNKVLNEQKRQLQTQRTNEYSAEVVARLSEISSRTHRVQAYRVAASSFRATDV